MANSHPTIPLPCLSEPIPIRYYPIRDHQSTPLPRALNPGEAYVVPNFEIAEELITQGVDSARIAVHEIDRLEEHPPRHVQLAADKELVPGVPFDFAQRILIILPTYNERSNLEALLTTISRYLVADVLIVDDNSPDGTGEIADQLSQKHPQIHVLHRPQKEGLGPAYLAGFAWALQRDYQLMIEMDCDFSHAPWDLPRLVHGSQTADLVIGSRYVPGGGTQNWNAFRRMVSQSGNTYVRLFLGSRLHDWTGGFRCYRRDLLTKMKLETVRARGYVFQVELAWRAVQLNARIRELPIRFRDRVHGSSKLGWASISEALREVPRLSFSGFSQQ